MSSWVRSDFEGIGLTQFPPGRYLKLLQQRYGGTALLCIDVSGSMSGDRLRAAIKGGKTFVREAVQAHYKCGVVLWSNTVDRYVPPDANPERAMAALKGAEIGGGTDLAPALVVAKDLFAALPGDRVLCVFGDGDIGGPESVRLARELCAMGVRIAVRGLGASASANLGRLLCPGAGEPDSQLIEDVQSIESGIASMASGLTAERRRR